MKIHRGATHCTHLRLLACGMSAVFVLFLSLYFMSRTAPAFASSTLAFTPGRDRPAPSQGVRAMVFLPSLLYDYSPIQPGPCSPGQSIPDPTLDVSPASIDVTEMSTTLQGETLQVVFHLRDVPEQLTFNRIGVPENRLEYEWSVYVDVDNNPQTGSTASYQLGTEYSLSVLHFVFDPDNPVTKLIPEGVQVNVAQYETASRLWKTIAKAILNVDAEKDMLSITGDLPGIRQDSQLIFRTLDQNPGGAVLVDYSSVCSPQYVSEQR